MRWLFTVLSLFSLLIGVATSALWVRSYLVIDRLYDQRYLPYDPLGSTDPADDDGQTFVRRYSNLSFEDGELVVQRWNSHAHKQRWAREARWELRSSPNDLPSAHYINRHLGFRFIRERGPGYDERTALIPLWSIELAASMLPLWWVYRWRRRIAINRIGSCERCGYNLTGNTSGICPECGAKLTMNSAVA